MGYNIEEQLELEQLMLDAGISRFRSQLESSIQHGRESHTLHGRTIVSHVVSNVAEGIREFQKQEHGHRHIAHKRLKDMDADKVAFLALSCMIDGLSKSHPLYKVANAIGGNVEMQDRLDKWRAEVGETATNVIKKANEKGATARRFGLTNKMNKDGFEHLAWGQDKGHVGTTIISIIIETTALVKVERLYTGRKKTTTYLRATEDTLTWVKAFNTHMETMHPRWMPTKIPPKAWSSTRGGGYYSDFFEDLPIIRRG